MFVKPNFGHSARYWAPNVDIFFVCQTIYQVIQYNTFFLELAPSMLIFCKHGKTGSCIGISVEISQRPKAHQNTRKSQRNGFATGANARFRNAFNYVGPCPAQRLVH